VAHAPPLAALSLRFAISGVIAAIAARALGVVAGILAVQLLRRA